MQPVAQGGIPEVSITLHGEDQSDTSIICAHRSKYSYIRNARDNCKRYW